jgi:hypothetical protein
MVFFSPFFSFLKLFIYLFKNNLDGENFTPLATKKIGCAKGPQRIFIFFGGKIWHNFAIFQVKKTLKSLYLDISS